jgi:hypothetical protein
MGCLAPFTGDFTLSLSIHRGKSTILCTGLHLTAPLSEPLFLSGPASPAPLSFTAFLARGQTRTKQVMQK